MFSSKIETDMIGGYPSCYHSRRKLSSAVN